jgi:hypothetical protein
MVLAGRRKGNWDLPTCVAILHQDESIYIGMGL